MRKTFLVIAAIIVLMTITFVSAGKVPANPCPISSDTDIVFYGETGFGGVGTLSRSWVIHFLDWWKTQDSSISYAELDSTDIKTDCNLASFPNLKVYLQPGGDAYKQQNKLDQAGKDKIKSYISSGKGYVGICAGFYYTASDYYWQDQYYAHPYLLGLYPTVEGSIREIADYDQSPGYALTGLSNGFNAIYYGGPTRGYEYTPLESPGTSVATFTSYGNGMPALIKYNNMLLSTVHLEAFENDGITGLSTEQRIENYKLLANLINEVSGTSFNVPAYTTPPQCSDGIDNDLDTLTDMNDPGCSSLNDNDETDPVPMQCNDGIDNDLDGFTDMNDPGCLSLDDNDETDMQGPAVLMTDNFESGISAWTLSGVGNAWSASTLNPYEGSYHANAKPSSTSEPASVMERSVSTSGYQNIQISYYRKLIGLDAADEFKAKWFDGTAWNVLEQTGSNSANDASYVLKTFSLPASAENNPSFKIRFECTAGAVSEFCRIDNVQVASI